MLGKSFVDENRIVEPYIDVSIIYISSSDSIGFNTY